MGDLLTRLSSFLNLQKGANISVPGVMVATAMLLVASAPLPPAYRAAGPALNPATLKALDIPTPCQTLSTDWHPTGATGSRLSPADWSQLDLRRADLESCALELQHVIVATQGAVARLTQQTSAEDLLASSLAKKYSDELLVASPLAPATKDEADRHAKVAVAAHTDLKDAESRVTLYNAILTRATDESKQLADVLHQGESEEPLADLARRLADRVLAFIVLAAVCGLVADPLMGLVQTLLNTDARTLRLNAAVPGIKVAPAALQLAKYNVNYALGLGLISQADLDALERRYLLPSQMLLNVAFGSLLLLPALGLYLDTHAAILSAMFRSW